MQTVSCPGCGAEVRFRSHAAVMAVCEFCRTGVLKDAGSVRDLGKIADVLEDYSPIQLGTSGTWGIRPFTVIGRLQLRYDDGFWNEWYLLFDDGAAGWLGDASGQYTISAERDAMGNTAGALPPFDSLRIGAAVDVAPDRYVAADVRTARCTGGQGELPFAVGDGWEAKVADLRAGKRFATLDYSDGPRPRVYVGAAVALDALRPQLLRDDDAVLAAAGRYRGKLAALDCPSCGSPIQYLPGMTANLVCGACRAQLDAASPQVAVLRAGERIAAVPTTLPLGAQGKLSKQPLTVIGVLRRVDDEGESWTEYLLYSPRAGFTWLVESDAGWQRADVLDEWPDWQGDTARVEQVLYRKRYDYEARVTYVAGAFNWRVRVGDRTRIVDFQQLQNTLSAEISAQEMTWSRARPVAFDQLKAWFPDVLGQMPDRASARAAQPGKLNLGTRHRGVAKGLIILLVLLNAVPLMFNFGGTFAYTVLGGLALYLPAVFLDNNDSE